MNATNPLVSVVTPFFNTEAYLEECIASVIRQTYPNWKYVLVNNRSTDRSADIAARYAREFPDRIRVEHNPDFLSQVQNYNRALSFVSPESRYCKIVQADDWIFPDCLRSMVEVAEANPSVGIVAAYELEGTKVSLDGLPYPRAVFPGHEISRNYLLGGEHLFGTPTSILMRSDLVRSRNPFYDERYAPFEDTHACLDLLKTSDFGFAYQVLTYSRRDNESILGGVREFNFEVMARMATLIARGHDFLDTREFECRRKALEKEYFTYLAKSAMAFNQRGPKFWDFHRRGLASADYRLGWRLLAPSVPRAFLEKCWQVFWEKWDRLFA